MERVSLLKDIKNEVPKLLTGEADSSFRRMFDTLMIVNFFSLDGDHALEQKRLALIEDLYRLLYAVFDDNGATQKELFLTYAVYEHLHTHLPLFRKKIETLCSDDAVFMRKFHTAEAMVIVRRALASISEPLKGLIQPLEKLENTKTESIGHALQKMAPLTKSSEHELQTEAPSTESSEHAIQEETPSDASSDALNDQDQMQFYRSISSVCRLNTANDDSFHTQLEQNTELRNRVIILWQSMYPAMSLDTMPATSYEYQLFQTRVLIFVLIVSSYDSVLLQAQVRGLTRIW